MGICIWVSLCAKRSWPRVRGITYEAWSDSDLGRATINSWQKKHILDVLDRFMHYIYPALVPNDKDGAVARALFVEDYDQCRVTCTSVAAFLELFCPFFSLSTLCAGCESAGTAANAGG
jgi:hypothetical protein